METARNSALRVVETLWRLSFNTIWSGRDSRETAKHSVDTAKDSLWTIWRHSVYWYRLWRLRECQTLCGDCQRFSGDYLKTLCIILVETLPDTIWILPETLWRMETTRDSGEGQILSEDCHRISVICQRLAGDTMERASGRLVDILWRQPEIL